MTSVTLPYSVAAHWCRESSSYQINDDIRSWLLERNQGINVLWSIDSDSKGILVTFSIENLDMALLFKLTWV